MKPDCSMTSIGYYYSRYSTTYGNREYGFTTPKRKLEKYEIEFYTENGGSAFLNDDEYQIKKGSIFISKPGDIRHSRLHFHAYFLYLTVESQYLKSFIDQLPSYFQVENIDNYIKLIHNLIKYRKRKSKSENLYVISKIYELCHMMYKDVNFFRESSSDINNKLFLVKNYMDENFQKQLSLKYLSTLANLNPAYFDRLFKTVIGVSPYNYLLEVRFNEAKNLLRFSKKSIDEIAELCGFSSTSYFSTSFKKKFGISPSGFRNIKYNNYNL